MWMDHDPFDSSEAEPVSVPSSVAQSTAFDVADQSAWHGLPEAELRSITVVPSMTTLPYVLHSNPIWYAVPDTSGTLSIPSHDAMKWSVTSVAGPPEAPQSMNT
uniref:Unannotated protein n=1 Tax=freshwater metagenome TaxID=449393 RepID=A0A6J7MHM4_9ZZZZ